MKLWFKLVKTWKRCAESPADESFKNEPICASVSALITCANVSMCEREFSFLCAGHHFPLRKAFLPGAARGNSSALRYGTHAHHGSRADFPGFCFGSQATKECAFVFFSPRPCRFNTKSKHQLTLLLLVPLLLEPSLLPSLAPYTMSNSLQGLSHSLQVELSRFISWDLLTKVSLFRGCSEQFLVDTCILLREVRFGPEEVIWNVSDICREMYFVTRGKRRGRMRVSRMANACLTA